MYPPESNPEPVPADGRSFVTDAEADAALLDDWLALSPADRIRRNDRSLALVRALRLAGTKLYGFDPRPPQAAG